MLLVLLLIASSALAQTGRGTADKEAANEILMPDKAPVALTPTACYAA